MKIFSTPRMLVSTCQDSTYATDISWCSTTSHIRFVGRRKEREKRWGGERGRKEEEKKREKGEGERGEIGKRKKRRDKEGEQREGRGREREKRGREKCVSGQNDDLNPTLRMPDHWHMLRSRAISDVQYHDDIIPCDGYRNCS